MVLAFIGDFYLNQLIVNTVVANGIFFYHVFYII
jgi:hypothetical protein